MEINFLVQKANKHIEQMEAAFHQISFESHKSFIRHQTHNNNEIMKLKDLDEAQYKYIIEDIAIKTWRLKHGSKRRHLVQDPASE